MCFSMGLTNGYVNAEGETGMLGKGLTSPLALAQVKMVARRPRETLDV